MYYNDSKPLRVHFLLIFEGQHSVMKQLLKFKKIGGALFLSTIIAFILVFSIPTPSAAQKQTFNASLQNAMGDVKGPVNGGSTSSILPFTPPAPSKLPSITAITSGINSGLFLPGLQGNPSLTSILGNITNMFDNLPAALQAAFLDAILNSNLIPADITKLITQFQQLKTLFDSIQNMSCGGSGGVSQDALVSFAQNSLASMIDPQNLFSFAGPSGLNISVNIGTNPAGFAKQALGGLATSICPGLGAFFPGLGGIIPGATGASGAVPTPGGPPAVGTSPCKSAYQSQRAALPSKHLGKNHQNILNHIRSVSSNLGMPPETLAGIIWFESLGGNPQASVNQCPKASATGLIQFVRKTAVGLGMHNHTTCSAHIATVKGMDVATQMGYVEKYFNSCGWKAGMSDLQAYRCVHAGNPGGNAVDSVNGKTSDTHFNNSVLPKIEAFRCQPGGYDWNTMSWTVDNGAPIP